MQERLKELTQSYRESCGDDADIKALLNLSSVLAEAQKIAHSFVPSNYAPICVSLSHSLSALVQYNYRRKNPSPTGFKEAALANLSACLKANNLTSCLFAAELSKASGPDIQIFASPLDKNISLLASEYGIMLSQERLEDIASLNPTQALSKEQKREQFHSLVILALLSQNMLWILTKDFYTKKYEYRAECREIEYRAQDWLMAQTTQDFTRIGCVNKEDCKNKESVHSRWFKRHFECRYFDDEGKLYPLNEECAQILKHTRFQVALLLITTLKDIMSLRQAYNQHYELAKVRYLAACEAGLESYMCKNPQYFYSQGIHSFVLETEGVCPLQPIP